jgi:site-specific recombinase XerD
MNPHVLDDLTLVDRYLDQMDGVKPATKVLAGSILHPFQAFVNGQRTDGAISLATLRQWMHNRREVWTFDCLMHRLAIVERFLDWLVLSQQLTNHPLAELRQTYGKRHRRLIVCALLSADPQKALDQFRPLPRFASHLGAAMQAHLARMRTLGYRYEREEYHLLQFDRYLQTRPGTHAQPPDALVREWIALAANPILKQQRLAMGRALTRSLRRADPTVSEIPPDRSLMQVAKRQQRSPHIYSENDICQLLTTARQWTSHRVPLRHLTLEAMLTLAYGAGLRLGELIRLTLSDLDLTEETIAIRDTKFFKSRRLPLAPTVMTTLRQYVMARRQAGASQAAEAALFWNEQNRRGYAVVTAEHLLTQVIRRAGLKPTRGRIGPRVHDLRHTFVVHRMLGWYRDGIDPQQRLHHLATWMGHKDIHSTLVYLTITQELLEEASQRFHTYGAQALQATMTIGGPSCH